MKRILLYITSIISATSFPNKIRGTDNYIGDETNYHEKQNVLEDPSPISLKNSSVKPIYQSRNGTKPIYPSMGVNKKTNPNIYSISDDLDTTVSNISDISNKSMKSNNKGMRPPSGGMKPPMSGGMPGPGSSSNSSDGNKSNGTIKWILIICIAVVAVIIILLTIYALWIWCSPVETNKILIENEMNSEGMTDDELKRFRMRFGRD